MSRQHPRLPASALRGALCTALVVVTAPALAQPDPRAPPQPAPAQPDPAAKPDEEKLGPGEESLKETSNRLAEALRPQPGGLTLDAAAREAIAVSPAVRAREADLMEAEGQTDQTMVQFFPRLTLTASYTRLSDVEQGTLGGGGAILGSLNEGPVTVGPCPNDPTIQCVIDSGGVPVQAQAFGFEFPTILNQFSFTANLTVPISDYFLRSVQAYAASEHNETALRLQTEAARLNVGTEARLAVLGWVLARGQTLVTQSAVDQAKSQLADAKATFQVGSISQADVMRIEALLAGAELNAAEAATREIVARERLRTILRAPPEREFLIGVDVFKDPGLPKLATSEALVQEAVRNRLELQANAEARKASEEVESVTNSGYWPRLDGFADAYLQNPNARIIPAREEFDFTWDVGVRLTWTVNDTFSTLGSSKQARARTARIDAQRESLIDAIRMEVVQAHADVLQAGPSIEAARRGVTAAEETLRVTRKLFAFGKSTGTAIADAENSLTIARLRALTAFVNLNAAIVRLDHALGRDRSVPLVRK
jgi:outer membrane protein TolC